LVDAIMAMSRSEIERRFPRDTLELHPLPICPAARLSGDVSIATCR
jgi:hypothetical protein